MCFVELEFRQQVISVLELRFGFARKADNDIGGNRDARYDFADARYEVPPALAFGKSKKQRRMPHIYSYDEIQRPLGAAAQLTPKGSIRPATYVTLLSLIAATGLRISEAL